MNRKFDNIMFQEIKIKSITLRIIDILFLFCITVIGFMIRFSMRHIESGDWTGSFTDWLSFITQNGGFHALAMDSFEYEYNCLYMYILCLVSYIKSPFSAMYWLKLASVIFDYFIACIIFLIIHHLTGNNRKAILSYAITVIFPTIALNSSAWTQCDSMYTSFLILSLYFILKDKSFPALLCVGVSFAFKLQATFFLPFLIIMWLKGKVKLRHFLILPIPLFISILPVWLMGRNLSFLLGRYLEQSQAYPNALTVSYPNIYVIFEPNDITKYAASACLLFTVSLFGCLAYYIYIQNFRLNADSILLIALFTAAVSVYFLPHMHERYGYIVDLLAIIYGSYNIKKIYYTIGFGLVSVLSYIPYLFKASVVPGYYPAALMLLLIILVGRDLHDAVAQSVSSLSPK